MAAHASFKVSGYCQGARDQAAALIYNAATSGTRVFTVRNFVFREATPFPANATLYNIGRTSAQAGGDEVDLEPLDTAAASVPTQVKVANYAVITPVSHMHGRWLLPTALTFGGPLAAGGYGPGTGFTRSDTSSIFDHRGFSTTQNVVLREGEGIAFVNPSVTENPLPVGWLLQGTLKIGTDTYTFSTILNPAQNGQTGLGIFNGSGSGVVVEVMSLSFLNPSNPTAIVMATDSPSTRICRVFGYDGNSGVGEAMTITSLSGAPAPSQLQVLRNRPWNPLFVGTYVTNPSNGISISELGYPGTLAVATYRSIGAFRHSLNYVYSQLAAGGASAGAFTSVFQGNSVGGPNSYHTDGSNGSTSGIRLNSGEGLAFIVDNPSIYSNYYFEAEITHEPPQVSGTSPMGYSS